MVHTALHPSHTLSPIIDAAWVAAAADRVLTALEEHRSTWQIWHVRAEAQRQIRAANLTTDKVDQLVDLLVAEVLNTRSIPLTPPDDTIVEPVPLRRADGSSVYTVAGADLFTSTRILEAERRLVATAGRTDGRTVDAVAADLALLEAVANGMALDAGQAGLVRSMATSGARLQLAIAPAGGARPQHYAPSPRRGWRAAGEYLRWPRPPPRPHSFANTLGRPPTHSPNSPGPSNTKTPNCPTGSTALAG
jgi:hypothetical protein